MKYLTAYEFLAFAAYANIATRWARRSLSYKGVGNFARLWRPTGPVPLFEFFAEIVAWRKTCNECFREIESYPLRPSTILLSPRDYDQIVRWCGDNNSRRTNFVFNDEILRNAISAEPSTLDCLSITNGPVPSVVPGQTLLAPLEVGPRYVNPHAIRGLSGYELDLRGHAFE